MARKLAVLLVDQNPDRRFRVKQLVAQAQFAVCGEAGYGKAAISLATEVKPDIILCAMEKVTERSAQTVESLIDALPETPVVVYSPDSDLEIARQAMQSGARDFLPMPVINAEALRKTVIDALESEGRRRLRLSGAHELPHLVDERLALERLGDVSVGARRAGARVVEGLERPGQEEHRDALELGIGLDRLADLVPVLARHHHVREDHVRLQRARASHGVLAISDRCDLEVFAREDDPHHLLDGDGIIRE